MSNQRIGNFPYGELERAMRFYMHGGPKPTPVLFLKFGEGSGSEVKDSSPNETDGDITGATWVEGKKGKALSFDGVNDFVAVSDAASLDLEGEAITVAAWVKLGTQDSVTNEHAYVVVKGIDADPYFNYGLFLDLRTDPPKIHVGAALDGTWRSETGSEVSLNVWHHLAFTYDGETFRMYIDGVETDTADYTGSLTANDKDIHVGGESGETDRWLNAVIDEIRVYDVVFTADQIRQLYEGID